jgi:hypothetical protein
LDPQQNSEHEARQFESNCGHLSTRFGSLQILQTRLVPPIFRQFVERIRSRIAPQFAEAGGIGRPRVTIFSHL